MSKQKQHHSFDLISDIFTGRRWQDSKNSRWVAVCGFIILSVIIVTSGWWLFQHQKENIRKESLHELAAIAKLKTQQIAEWRKEKLADAELLRNNPILAAQLETWIKQNSPSDDIYNKLRLRMSALLRAYRYHAVVLLDTHANPLLYIGAKWRINQRTREAGLEALETKQSLYSDIDSLQVHENADNSKSYLDLLVPVLAGTKSPKKAVALFLIRLKPEDYLFPLVETWPTPSKTSESVLMKPGNRKVTRLTGRRHVKENGMRDMVVRTDRISPPGMVLSHHEGSLEHLDYRNIPVFSYVKHVENSPWYLVAKVDQAEVYAPINRLAIHMTFLVVVLVTAAGLIVFYWWRQIHTSFLATHYQSELDKQLLEQRFNVLSKYANDIILLVDQRGMIVEANDRAVEIFDYPYDELLTMRLKELRPEEDHPLLQEQRRNLLEQGKLMFEGSFVKSDGSTFPAEVSARIIELQGEQYFQGILRDITERKKAESEIKYLAHHDSLTGLPNRNLLQDRLHQSLAQARRAEKKAAILFLDFDRFKNINDSLGHSFGDGVLKQVAKRLTSCLREGDTVARVGGDEFVIVLSDLEDASVAAKVARKVTDLGTEAYLVENQKFRLTISIGISLFPEDGEDIETLLKNADSAMYHAKQAGRNTFYFYTEDMNTQALEALSLENDLQQAIVAKEFFLHYQPQVEIESGRIVGVEALIRWNHPDKGVIEPARFIPIAEERGLIVPIGDWVLEEACRQSIEWQQQGLAPVRMAVNISALQFHHADFYQKLESTLEKTGLQPDLLELELTESAVMRNEGQNPELLEYLKRLGVKLAIDDFGTGYSSLSYLKRFPIDKLKIDRSFIKDLPSDSEDEAITQAIIGVGRTLKHNVLAEGVETLAQQEFLLREGCREMQGFYFSHPLPANEFAKMLKQNS